MNSADYSSDTSSSKKPFKCTEKGCSASFIKNSKLIVHIRKHSGERPFVCDEAGCSKTYTNSSHLRRHKKISHGERESQTVMCQIEGCGLVLANKYSLKKHYNHKHNTESYEFVCTECLQGFHRKKQLQQHLYLHTGEAPFKCSDCEMSFTTNRNLNRHRRSHRTYICDCGRTFKKWSLILSHKKLCKQPRFTCGVCDKKFSHHGNYKNHKLVHVQKSEKLVFICPYSECKRYYFYKKNLKYHINIFHKKITENKTYHCTYPKCKVVLKTKRSFKMHFQRHFKWIHKKQRKTRYDKGKLKKSIVSVLIGENELETKLLETNDEQRNNKPKNIEKINENYLENNHLQIIDPIPDKVLLKQCDLTLSLLNERITAAS